MTDTRWLFQFVRRLLGFQPSRAELVAMLDEGEPVEIIQSRPPKPGFVDIPTALIGEPIPMRCQSCGKPWPMNPNMARPQLACSCGCSVAVGVATFYA